MNDQTIPAKFCPACRGTGLKQLSDLSYMRCPACDGRGTVKGRTCFFCGEPGRHPVVNLDDGKGGRQPVCEKDWNIMMERRKIRTATDGKPRPILPWPGLDAPDVVTITDEDVERLRIALGAKKK